MIRSLVRPVLAAAVLLASGCMVEAHPARPAVMPPAQAVSIAAGYARAHGVLVDSTLAARLDRHARWHVELAGAGGRDHAVVLVDGSSGAILHARLRAPRGAYAPPPPPVQGPPPPPPAAPPPPAPGGSTPPPPAQGSPPPPPPAQGAPPAPGTPGPTPVPPPG